MTSSLWRVGPAIGALVLGILTASPETATADVGAGVGAAPVLLSTTARPGTTYRLPALYVVNTGTEVSTYRLNVAKLSSGKGQAVPAAWVRFARNDVALEPKASTSVPMALTVPRGAVSGSYVSDLVVGTVAPRPAAAGAAAGARAATELAFQVGTAGSSSSPWPWWSYVAIGGVLVLGGAFTARKRYGIKLRVERRR